MIHLHLEAQVTLLSMTVWLFGEVEREVETSMISVISTLEAPLNAQFGLNSRIPPIAH